MAETDESVWYLHEWFATQGMIQRDLITKLDYLPAKANKLWHGIQPFRAQEVREIAELLNIRPHELLMPPEEAMAIRRLRSVVAEVGTAPPATQPQADVIASRDRAGKKRAAS